MVFQKLARKWCSTDGQSVAKMLKTEIEKKKKKKNETQMSLVLRVHVYFMF